MNFSAFHRLYHYSFTIKADNTFNGQGSVTQIIRQNYVGSQWVDSRKEQFFYTPGGFLKKFLKFNIQNEFSNVNCGGESGVTTLDAEKWDWRYRYSAFGTREQKRLNYSPHGDSCDYLHPWVYYLQGAGGEQLAVYHGIQTSQETVQSSGRRVLMYASQYLTNGGELSYNLASTRGLTKDFQITDYIGNVRTLVSLDITSNTFSVSSYDYKPFGDTLNTSTGSENRLGFIGRERDYENSYFSFGARNYDSETGRFLSVDPLFEAFMNITPYNYAYNSPVQFKDPSGLAPEDEKKEKVQYSEVMGYNVGRMEEIYRVGQYYNILTNDFTDDVNESMDAWDLWEEIVSMNTRDDSEGGSGGSGSGRTSGDGAYNGEKSTIIDETGKVIKVIDDGDLGIYMLKKGQKWDGKSTTDLERVSQTKTIHQYKESQQWRPDDDGYLTLKEANWWYRHGNGQPLYADFSKIDLYALSFTYKFQNPGDSKYINLFVYNSRNRFVYGTIKMTLGNDYYLRASYDNYNFEMHNWNNPLNWPRNFGTILGGLEAGDGIPFKIYFYGKSGTKFKH